MTKRQPKKNIFELSCPVEVTIFRIVEVRLRIIENLSPFHQYYSASEGLQHLFWMGVYSLWYTDCDQYHDEDTVMMSHKMLRLLIPNETRLDMLYHITNTACGMIDFIRRLAREPSICMQSLI